MPLAYSYLRFSTADQLKGDSQRRQSELARAWAEENGVEFAEDYQDFGVSAFRGKNAENGALAAFMAEIDEGRIERGSILVVESLDRLSRTRVVDALTQFLSIIRKGVEIVTLADRKRYSEESVNASFADLIVSITIMSRAHEESAMKSSRNRESWKQKRKRAREAGQVMTAKGPSWLRLSADRSAWEVLEEKAASVRRAFQLAADGMGQYAVARTLNAEGAARLGGGKSWYPGVVWKLLRDRAVIGEMTMKECGEGREMKTVGSVPGYYPAIVSEGEFARVQSILNSRSRANSGRRSGVVNIFRGLAHDISGERAYFRTSYFRHGPVLMPKSVFLGERKPSVFWLYEDLKGSFLLLVDAASRAQAGERDSARLDQLESRKAARTERIGNLVRLMSATYTPEGADELARAQGERAEIEDQIRSEREEVAASRKGVDEIDWNDDARLAENVAATVRRVDIDFDQRAFTVELLDGRVFGYREEGDEVVVELPEGVDRLAGPRAS